MVAIVNTNRAPLTTRMPQGVTNAAPWQTMGLSGVPDPTWSHLYRNDFDQYVAADWSLTGTGTPTAALSAGNGGIITLSTTAGANDSVVFQKTPAAFAVVANKQMFFKFAGTLSSVAGAFFCGIADIGEGAEGATVDGILINKAAGVSTLTLDIFVASAKTSFAFPATCTLAAATAFELGFAIDPIGNVLAFYNPTTGNNQINASVVASSGQSRGAVAVAAAPSLPTTNMAPVCSYVNASAAAQTIKADYFVVSNER